MGRSSRVNDKSHRTAISRKGLSAPARWLLMNDRIRGKCLDFGCGRGTDAALLGADKWDPYWHPIPPLGAYDTVISVYVANVLTDEEVPPYLEDLWNELMPGGRAYIAVRRDVKREGWTSRGTYQTNRELGLPVVHKCSGFVIYELRRPMK